LRSHASQRDATGVDNLRNMESKVVTATSRMPSGNPGGNSHECSERRALYFHENLKMPALRQFDSHSIWIAFLAMLLLADAARAVTYRVMPVGDSITAGYTDNPTWSQPYDFGYRGDLYELLSTNGYVVSYVGGSQEPLNNAFPVTNPPITVVPPPNLRSIGQDKHEGYGGKKTDYFSANVASFLAANNPDAILLMVGINDFSRGASLASAAASIDTAKVNLNNTVRTIVTNKPNAKLIVAQTIPPMAPSTAVNTTPAIGVYNDYIKNVLVPTYAAQGKFVTTVDQYANFLNAGGTAIDASLYSNAINHPNATGYGKMAVTWYNGIRAIDLDATAASAQAAALAANLVVNGNFDAATPAFTTNSHNINPTGTSWTFTAGTTGAGSGVDRGNAYSGSNATSAEGSQMAFLQSSGNGSVTRISQQVSGFVAGHKYRLTFQAKAISPFGGANPFFVQMSDGTTTIPLFSGSQITPLTAGYLPYATSFTATAPQMTLSFFDAGLTVNNKVSWIDSVEIVDVTPVPEPATLGLLWALCDLSGNRRRATRLRC
jgi:lysophospholipase L1-like esterase